MSDKGWTMGMVTGQIILDASVSHPAFRLFSFLSLKQGQGEEPNLTKMAAGLGTNTRAVKRLLKELSSYGYVESEPIGKRKIRYNLIAVPDLAEGTRPRPVPLTKQHQLMLKALAATCAIDLATVGRKTEGSLNQSARVLREAGAAPEDFSLFKDYWTTQDWRGQKGSPPRPNQVRELWGEAMTYAEEQGQGEADLPTY